MTKDQIQRRIIADIVKADFRGIVLSSVRSGKTRILITAIKEHCKKENPKVLVLYPNVDIKNSWEDECAIIGCPMSITYCTFISMGKMLDEEWDYIVMDEAHLIPEEHKLPIAGEYARKYNHVILASGTYNRNTLADLRIHTVLPLIVEYTTEEAIDDGIISDYTVYIHQYELNPHMLRQFGTTRKWWNTDTKELARLTEKFDKSHGDLKMFAALARMRFINANDSLLFAVNKWRTENPGKRFLMFTENEGFAKKFRLPMFNSKSKDDSVLKSFIKKEINQLCLIKKGSAGITYPDLDNILITSINSNGETLEQMLGRSLLIDTEHSDIHVFVTDKIFQLNWLESALYNIPKEKIIWVKQPGKVAGVS
jgi:superfamily II DNA or RNA helicase